MKERVRFYPLHRKVVPKDNFQILVKLGRFYFGYIQYMQGQDFSDNLFRLLKVDGCGQLPTGVVSTAERDSLGRIMANQAREERRFCHIRNLVLHE